MLLTVFKPSRLRNCPTTWPHQLLMAPARRSSRAEGAEELLASLERGPSLTAPVLVFSGAPRSACRAASILPGTLGCAGRSWLCPARLAWEAARAQRREAGLRMKGPGPAGWHPCLRRLRRKLRHDENAPDLGKFSSATAFHLCVGCVCVCRNPAPTPSSLEFPRCSQTGDSVQSEGSDIFSKAGR